MKYLILIVLVFFVYSAFAQTDVTAVDACRLKSLSVPVNHPGKLQQAQEEAFQRCLTVSLPSPQRRQIALYKSAQAACNIEADNAVKLDNLITAAERTKIYSACLNSYGYLQ